MPFSSKKLVMILLLSCHEGMAIDYILFKGLECIYSETVNEIYADHLPIIAEFI
jgi:endonuclease/exonuclease/phosphatase (EEP) superfamily protein YafD